MLSHTGDPSSSARMMVSATCRRIGRGVDASSISRRMSRGAGFGGFVRWLESAAGTIVDVAMMLREGEGDTL
jgi:hypothetical protein